MWVTVEEFKLDAGITDTRDDAALRVSLDAAVAFVEGVHKGKYNFDPKDSLNELPLPTPDLTLGTLRLARRWFVRRKSPAAVIEMQEMGSARIPSFDPDIDRLLKIGRYRGPGFA